MYVGLWLMSAWLFGKAAMQAPRKGTQPRKGRVTRVFVVTISAQTAM